MSKQLYIDIIARNKSLAAFRQVQNSTEKTKQSILSLKNALVALGAGAAIKSIIGTTARFEDLRTSLASVTGSAEQGAEAFDFISKFATQTQFSVEDLSRTFIKLKAAGITPTVELLNVFTNTAAITTDQIGSLEAVTDLFARTVSGGLGLEEINRLGDRGVPVLRILEEQLGITRLELSEFGKTAEGAKKITDAFAKGIQQEFGDATSNLVNNLSTQFSNLQIALSNNADAFGQGLSPAIKEATQEVTDLLVENQELVRSLGKDLGDALTLVVRLVFGLVDGYKQLNEITKDLTDNTTTLFSIFALGTNTLGIVGDKLDNTKDKYEGATDTLIDANARLKKSIDKTYSDSSGVIRTLGEFEDTALDNTFSIKSMGTELDNTTSSVRTFNSGFMETLGRARDLKTQFDDLATNTFNNFSDTLADALMTGKFAFKDFARSVLRDIARIIARQYTLLAIQRTLSFLGIGFPNMVGVGLPSFGGFRANGGNVQAGQAYMVGERGAEMFVPQQSGTIIPNQKVNTGTTNINFTINTVDAQGVDELLTNRRSTIINVINDALNRQGKEALV